MTARLRPNSALRSGTRDSSACMEREAGEAGDGGGGWRRVEQRAQLLSSPFACWCPPSIVSPCPPAAAAGTAPSTFARHQRSGPTCFTRPAHRPEPRSSTAMLRGSMAPLQGCKSDQPAIRHPLTPWQALPYRISGECLNDMVLAGHAGAFFAMSPPHHATATWHRPRTTVTTRSFTRPL